MVECHEIKSSMCGKLTLKKEKLFLELLKLFIDIQEPTRIESIIGTTREVVGNE